MRYGSPVGMPTLDPRYSPATVHRSTPAEEGPPPYQTRNDLLALPGTGRWTRATPGCPGLAGKAVEGFVASVNVSRPIPS